MKMTHRLFCRLAVASLLFATGTPVLGATLAYEGFNYAPGSPLPGLGGGIGWVAPWVGSASMTAVPPTLQHPFGLPSTGIKMNNPTVGEAFRDFAGAGLSNLPDDLWISFMEQKAVVGPDEFVHLDPLGAGGPDIVLDNTGGGVVNATVGGGPAIFLGLSAGSGNTDFLMLHVTHFLGSSSIEFFLNSNIPTAGAGPFAVPLTFREFYFRTDPGVDIDEIRAGTTEQDVSAVPAPGAVALLAFAALARRRRR